MNKSELNGRVTLPIEKGIDQEVQLLIKKWKADAVRNSDGTELPEGLKKKGIEVYSTLSLPRADQAWAKVNRDKLLQKYLLSDPVTARSDTVEIDLMKGYFSQEFEIDFNHTPEQWWEVIDRTTGRILQNSEWELSVADCKVRIFGATPFHIYTVSFLVYQIWDPTSMNNHLINNWTSAHVMGVDIRHPETRAHLLAFLDRWLTENPETDVVRLTSLAYHFTNLFSDKENCEYIERCRFFDWTGYHDCISPQAMEDFSRKYGYKLRPEDFIDEGYLNDVNRIPSKKYLDWIEFNHEFVVDICSEWVTHIQKAGKKAMMFFCDHWIGSEPYGQHFARLGLDAIVNPCGNGIELRRIADIPADITKEVRLYPYFFPTSLYEGADPASECQLNWVKIRRAMLQNMVDRIGFGGYLKLALKFPKLIETITDICDEFREMHNNIRNAASYKGIKVGILNAWGKLRSWVGAETNAWGSPYRGTALECLSGMNVDIEFISFEDILKSGVPKHIDVIVNVGDAGTAWSGGHYWTNEKIVTAIREWIHNGGGGLIGIGEPTGFQHQGRFFQLSDLLGVEREMGLSIGKVKSSFSQRNLWDSTHFIMGNEGGQVSLGDIKDRIYAVDGATQVLLKQDGNVLVAANTYGKGRAVYLAGLDFSWRNTRLLLRAIYWAARKEQILSTWFSDNIYTECAAYPATGNVIVVNNSSENQETYVSDAHGNKIIVKLDKYESRWFKTREFSIAKCNIKPILVHHERLTKHAPLSEMVDNA